jgi:glyoxylase-like metal-dependent hydrolase (beta-lactamase superfamily II)
MVHRTLFHFDNKIIEWQWSAEHELLRAPYWASCFLIDGLLIDSGPPGGLKDFRKFVKKFFSEGKIDKCIITHSHEDHCGGAHLLQSEFNIPVYASKKAIPLIINKKSYPDYRQIAWGSNFTPFEALPIEYSISTTSKKYNFDIFPMPGHAEELITLIEREKQWAFTTDAVMPNYKLLFGPKTDIPEDISIIYQSIKNLYEETEGLTNLHIISSGRGVFKGRDFLKEKLEELEKLHNKAHKFHEEGLNKGLTNKRLYRYVLKKIFQKESYMGGITQGDVSIMNLIISLLNWPLE